MIVAEFDVNALDWQGEPPSNLVDAYNDYYLENPWEAFELALKDERFRVVRAQLFE